MKSKKILKQQDKALVRRYLIWCYKTTKERLDRIDRYFTQLQVDEVVLKHMSSCGQAGDGSLGPDYDKLVEDFRLYMKNKRDRVIPQKFLDGTMTHLQPEYRYLQSRLQGIEKAIRVFLGASQLKSIQHLYEAEMTRRILESREET